MRKPFLLVIFASLFIFYNCDDGDIIDFEFGFDDTFNACQGVLDLVLYKTKNDPSESVSVLIPNFTLEDIIAVDETGSYTEDKTATFNYRNYSDASISDLFCNDIPVDVDITLDEEDSVTATIATTLTEDDNDGILASLEDINGNGDLTDDDTDGDGLPNYIDADDDGDNILTKDEDPDPDGDGLLNDALDTDGDSIPDYLDNDDDGDGVDTRDEENESQDNNPANDVSNNDIGADYLNPDVSNTVPATAYRTHTISQTYIITLKVTDISIDFLSQETYDFGILSNSITSDSRSETPPFN